MGQVRRRPGRLLAVGGGVVAAQLREVGVGSLLDQAAGLQDDDQVGAADRGNLVRDNQAGAAR